MLFISCALLFFNLGISLCVKCHMLIDLEPLKHARDFTLIGNGKGEH